MKKMREERSFRKVKQRRDARCRRTIIALTKNINQTHNFLYKTGVGLFKLILTYLYFIVIDIVSPLALL